MGIKTSCNYFNREERVNRKGNQGLKTQEDFEIRVSGSLLSLKTLKGHRIQKCRN